MITVEKLRSVLKYNRRTGVFRWCDRSDIPANVNSRLRGRIAGSLRSDGYREICVCGEHYLEHRLAWFYVKGVWPVEEIDHENLIRHENQFTNLREASSSNNKCNTRGHRDSASKTKGVRWNKNREKWEAYICINYRQQYLGLFDSKEDAVAARSIAANNMHANFARAA